MEFPARRIASDVLYFQLFIQKMHIGKILAESYAPLSYV